MKTQQQENQRRLLVSIIMPAHNSAKYIRQSIKSVIGQTLGNWELLVIDDASSDDTVQIVHAFAREDCRIKLHRNTTNQGTARSRNLGMEMSKGSFIAFLDSDDIWCPEKLERQIEVLEKEDVDLVCCAYGYMDEAGTPSDRTFRVPEQITLRQMLKENVVGCSTVMLTRTVAEQFRFSTQYYFEDYVFWLSMLQKGKRLRGLPDVMTVYRLHKKSRGSNKLLCAKHRWCVYREFMGFSRIKSCYYQLCYGIASALKYIGI